MKHNSFLGSVSATGLALALALGSLAFSSPAQTASLSLGPRGSLLPGVDEGELLLGELNCRACHKAEGSTEARLASRQSPRLGEGGLPITPQYLRAFLSDPNAEKPGTTMPDLLHSMAASERAQTVDALVHFLISLDKTNKLAAVGGDPGKIEQGRLLYHQAGCAACHAPQATAASLNPRTESPTASGSAAASALRELQAASVPLGNLAKKTTVEGLAKFLMDPLKARPSGRMPALNLKSDEATSIAMYLLRDQANQAPAQPAQRVKGLGYSYFEGNFGDTSGLDSQKPRETGLVEKFTLKPRKRNDNIGFRFTGFLNVPADGSYTFYCASDDGTRLYIGGKLVVENDGVHSTTEKSGTVRLPAGDHPLTLAYFNGGGELTLKVSYDGPGISKREIPAAALSTQEARAMLPLEDESFTLSPEKAERGKQLFSSLGCAACHQTGQGAAAQSVAAKPLHALQATAGCLNEVVGKGLPKYPLSAAQRTSLHNTLSSPEKLAQPRDAPEQVAYTLTAMNCLACHSRDGVGGPGPDRLGFFSVVGDADLGDEGRIPPRLTGVGGKLRPDWLRQVLVGKGTARPYMATRMPQFGEANVGHLVAALAKVDSATPGAPAAAPSAREVGFGRKLVGTDGLACISCHTFGGHKSLGIPAMDLTLMTQRLNKEWFHRYAVDPAALRPGTRMPSFWPEGKSSRTDILNGDTERQINAVWAYLAKAREAGLPQGLIQGKIELVATNEAIIYRHFIADAGSRAIGVGYPEKANLAFDANSLRLALIWQGPFLDASRHRTGRGEGFEGPLGYNIVKMPAGSSFAILASAGSKWPEETGQKAGFRMHGYRLDDQRRPTFLYSFQAVNIEDSPVAIGGELEASFRRTLTLRSAQPMSNLFFRAWAGSHIEASEDGFFSVDGRLKFKLLEASGAKPIIRQSGTQSELLVPVVFQGQEAKVVEEIIW